MAIQITSDTLVKILVRRGQEYDRKLTLLSNGELGYSQDISRLFIGDGVSLGGVPVSNIFHGFVANRSAYNSVAQPGDMLYQTSNNILYALNSETGNWTSVHPLLGSSLQYDANGAVDINQAIFPPPFSYVPYGSGPNPNTLTHTPGLIDLNSNYLSLSAPYTSFYFGNINAKTVTNNLSATVNVDKNIFINDSGANPNQLQLWANDANGNTSIVATRGNFVIKNISSSGSFSISTQNTSSTVWSYNNTTGSKFTFSTPVTGTYSVPNFDVDGLARFRAPVYFNNDATIYGSLSVLGNLSYIETNVTTTSALSVITSNNSVPALIVGQLYNSPDQIIAEFNGLTTQTQGRPALIVRDGPFVGINVSTDTLGSTTNARFMVSGTAIFGDAWPNETNDAFVVNTGSGGIALNATGNITSIINTATIASRNNNSIGRFVTINGTARSSSAIGLAVNSNGDQAGLSLVPEAVAGSYNPLVQTSDQAIIFYNGGGADTAGGLVIGQWSNNAAKGMRMDSSGNLGLGIYNPSYKLHVQGTCGIGGALYASSDISTGGNIYAIGDVVAFSSSDRALKKDITPIATALDKIEKINGVEFDWDTEKQSVYSGHDIGVIAQEIEAILPEAVTTREDGYKAVKYEKIIPLLIEAIKELKAQIK